MTAVIIFLIFQCYSIYIYIYKKHESKLHKLKNFGINLEIYPNKKKKAIIGI